MAHKSSKLSLNRVFNTVINFGEGIDFEAFLAVKTQLAQNGNLSTNILGSCSERVFFVGATACCALQKHGFSRNLNMSQNLSGVVKSQTSARTPSQRCA